MALRDRVRAAVPFGARHQLAKARLRLRGPSGRLRALPLALVIGAQRSGTSSLYRYLSDHPAVASPLRKEVGYFSRSYHRGDDWYRAHFTWAGSRRLSFEATPDYLLHPVAAERVAERLPDVRCVVLLRDPVARAYSHHRHMVRLGYETLDFGDAVAAETRRIQPDLDRLAEDPFHDPRALLRYSYVARGHYADQLRRWFDHLPRDRFLVVRSEDFYADTARWFAEITAFLGLPPWRPPTFPNVSAVRRPGPAGDATPSGLREPTQAALADLFRKPNADLAELLDLPDPWW